MESSKYSFKNLELWKAAQSFAVEIARIVDALPNRRSADMAGRQLIRSSASIAANIAEGHARFSFAAYRNHLSIAKGSAGESQGWIDYLAQLGFIQEARAEELDRRCDALIGALTRRIVSLDRQQAASDKPRALRETGPEYVIDEEEVLRFEGSKVLDLREEEDDR